MWLLKTEPGDYGYDDLERERRTMWNGVTNPVALRNMREMRKGDECFVYHTGGEKAVVGVAEVEKAAYPDPQAGDERIVAIDIKAVRKLARPVTLAEMKAMSVFQDSPLARQGRLSVVPLTKAQWAAVLNAGER